MARMDCDDPLTWALVGGIVLRVNNEQLRNVWIVVIVVMFLTGANGKTVVQNSSLPVVNDNSLPENCTFLEHQRVRLKCSSNTNDVAWFWMKSGERKDSASRRRVGRSGAKSQLVDGILFEMDNTDLTFNMTHGTDGHYYCEDSNGIGRAYIQAKVKDDASGNCPEYIDESALPLRQITPSTASSSMKDVLGQSDVPCNSLPKKCAFLEHQRVRLKCSWNSSLVVWARVKCGEPSNSASGKRVGTSGTETQWVNGTLYEMYGTDLVFNATHATDGDYCCKDDNDVGHAYIQAKVEDDASGNCPEYIDESALPLGQITPSTASNKLSGLVTAIVVVIPVLLILGLAVLFMSALMNFVTTLLNNIHH